MTYTQLTVITVQKVRAVNIALDASALNHELDEDKHQMPNYENPFDMIAERIDKESIEAWYSSLDMTYAYGQVPLRPHQKLLKPPPPRNS